MTKQTFIPLDRNAHFARTQWHSRQPNLKEEKAEKPRPGARTGWREQRDQDHLLEGDLGIVCRQVTGQRLKGPAGDSLSDGGGRQESSHAGQRYTKRVPNCPGLLQFPLIWNPKTLNPKVCWAEILKLWLQLYSGFKDHAWNIRK